MDIATIVKEYAEGPYKKDLSQSAVRQIQDQLAKKADMKTEEALILFHYIVTETVPVEDRARALTTLFDKQVTSLELAVFAAFMRHFTVTLGFSREEGKELYDTCGTGGDGLGLFNISTASAFVLASMGYRIAKHGNRAVTSTCGSSEMIAALGARIDCPPEVISRSIREIGFGFLYAPMYHPIMKAIMPVRHFVKEHYGTPTIFNYLGPLINPAGARNHCMGVSDARMHKVMAQTMIMLGFQDAAVVLGRAGEYVMDEVSLCGPTEVIEIHDKNMRCYTVAPSDFSMKERDVDTLRAGGPEDNARLFKSILASELHHPVKDAVVINAAFAHSIFAQGTDNLEASVKIVLDVMNSGKTRKLLDKYREFTTKS